MKAGSLALYLASGSSARRALLQAAEIPFTVIGQHADESLCSLAQPLLSLVQEIAQLKMGALDFPSGAKAGEEALFLTADTMIWHENSGKFFAKPRDRQQALAMLRASRSGTLVGSGFCLARARFDGVSWQRGEQLLGYDEGFCRIDIPEGWLDWYLERVPFTAVAGGITIEGLGEPFVEEIRGSYSAILGLPMVKLRQALEDFTFYSPDNFESPCPN